MLLITIWPIFALICLGFMLIRLGFPSAEFWPAAERINYFLLFPALLIGSLADAPVHDRSILELGAASAATLAIAALLLALARRWRPMPAARFGPILQGVVRFNTYIALAVLAFLGGSTAVERAAIFLAVAVPLVNVLSIIALTDTPAARAPLVLVRTVLRNPLVIACMIGFALALSGIGLPFGAGGLLSMMGQASLPLGLLCIGAALRPEALLNDMAGLAGTALLRLLLMPALAAAVGHVFGLSGVEATVLIVFSAVPTAPTSYILARQLNADAPFMAGIVTSQTMASVLSLPLVLFILQSL